MPGRPRRSTRQPLGLREMALEPDEAARRRQLGEQRRPIQAENAREPRCRGLQIEHLRGIGEQRGLGIVGREQIAVAIDDVGAPRARRRAGDGTLLGRGVHRHQGEIAQPQPEDRKGQDEDADDHAQPAAGQSQVGVVTAHDATPWPWPRAVTSGAGA